MNEKEIEMTFKIKNILKENNFIVDDIALREVYSGHDREYVWRLRIEAKKEKEGG